MVQLVLALLAMACALLGVCLGLWVDRAWRARLRSAVAALQREVAAWESAYPQGLPVPIDELRRLEGKRSRRGPAPPPVRFDRPPLRVFRGDIREGVRRAVNSVTDAGGLARIGAAGKEPLIRALLEELNTVVVAGAGVEYAPAVGMGGRVIFPDAPGDVAPWLEAAMPRKGGS